MQIEIDIKDYDEIKCLLKRTRSIIIDLDVPNIVINKLVENIEDIQDRL